MRSLLFCGFCARSEESAAGEVTVCARWGLFRILVFEGCLLARLRARVIRLGPMQIRASAVVGNNKYNTASLQRCMMGSL